MRARTLTLQTEIAEDGVLRLEVPWDLPPGPAEVSLVVLPETLDAGGPPYPSLRGIWAGKMPDIDVDAELREMDREWRDQLEP